MVNKIYIDDLILTNDKGFVVLDIALVGTNKYKK